MLEREIKLLVDGALDVTGCGDATGIVVGPAEERSIDDVYFDTVDLRLARWGCTLRYRPGDGWTVKLPAPATGRALERREVVMKSRRTKTPPPEAIALVRSMTRGQPVEAVARFATTRFAHELSNPDRGHTGELVDDRVVVALLGRDAAPSGPMTWRELEIELADGTPEAAVDGLVADLERAGAEPCRTPKLIRALGSDAAGPPDVVEPDLGRRPTARDVVHAAIARSVTRLILHLPVARLGEDPEGVHQARVATRRLRSDLRTFRPLLDREWADALGDELRWLAATLGEVRDADVLLIRFRRAADAHPELDPAAMAEIIATLEAQRRRDTGRLLAALDSERCDTLLDTLVAAAADPPTTARADRRASKALPRLLAKRWRRIERAVAALDDDAPTDELHRIRILAKRARYAADAVAPGLAATVRPVAKALAAVQDELGDLNDAAVAEAWLTDLAPTVDGSTAYVAGRLAQTLVHEAASAGDRWRRPFDKAARRWRRTRLG